MWGSVMPDNTIGLEAIFENEQFQQGIAEYNSSVKDASSNTESGAGTMSAAWEGLSAVGAIAFTAIGAGIAALTAELYLAVDAAMDGAYGVCGGKCWRSDRSHS